MENEQIKQVKLPIKPIPEAISLDDVYNLGQNIKNRQIRIIYYVLYLSGARVSEALKMRIKDIEFNISDKGSGLIIFTLITAKNRKHPIRTIPACYKIRDKPHMYLTENNMAKEIRSYVIDRGLREGGEKKLFTITRVQVWRAFTKDTHISVRAKHPVTGEPIENYIKKINPHYLRHCRLTHLRTMYGADAVTLMQFAGWSNMNMCRTYLHIGYKELAKMFD